MEGFGIREIPGRTLDYVNTPGPRPFSAEIWCPCINLGIVNVFTKGAKYFERVNRRVS